MVGAALRIAATHAAADNMPPERLASLVRACLAAGEAEAARAAAGNAPWLTPLVAALAETPSAAAAALQQAGASPSNMGHETKMAAYGS